MSTPNFIAFRFCDNDFHHPLKQAIEHIRDNTTSELSVEAWHSYVAFATDAFSKLRHVSQWHYEHDLPLDHSSLEYIGARLDVAKIQRLEDLIEFEGFVLDLHLNTVSYYAS